jgi:hypothetical protein
MSLADPDPDDPLLHLASARASLGELREAIREAPPRVLPSHVGAWLNGQAGEMADAVQAAIGRDPVLREVFERLLERRRVAGDDRRVAAASAPGERDRLVIDQATLFWDEIPGRDQVVVLLELSGSIGVAEGASPVLILRRGEQVAQLAFPGVIDGAAQLVLASNDTRLAWLRSADDVQYDLTVSS